MKVLIWILSFFVGSVVGLLWSVLAGVRLGAVPTVLLYAAEFGVARYFSKKWDEHLIRTGKKKLEEIPVHDDYIKENKSEALQRKGNNGLKQEPMENGFYFENLQEFLVYTNQNPNKSISWLQGDAYVDQCNIGFEYFEKKQYNAAINELRKALDLNPVGVSARFEICECYLGLKNCKEAKRTLDDVKCFIYDSIGAARFYRRNGFIAIEQKKYALARACYQYSQMFEDSPQAQAELNYINTLLPKALNEIPDKEAVLKANAIIILHADSNGIIIENIPNKRDELAEQFKKEMEQFTEEATQNEGEYVTVDDSCNQAYSNWDAEQITDVAPIGEAESKIKSRPRIKFCSKCGFKLIEDSKFCSKCGSLVKIENKCSSCGAVVPWGSMFCHHCGNAMK